MTVNQLHAKVKTFLKDYNGVDMFGDNCSLYTMEEWKDSGERVGVEASGGTLTCEGPVNQGLNYGWPRDGEFSFYHDFKRMVEDCGYYFELGYSWTVHFYPEY